MRNPWRTGPVEAIVPIGDPNTNDSRSTMQMPKSAEAGDHAPANLAAHHPGDNEISMEEMLTSDVFEPDLQEGVRKMEAITTTWTTGHVIAAYILMWIVQFMDALQQGAAGALNPYVTSSFQQHSLTAYTNVLSGIIAGVLTLPLAKVLDIFGRPMGFALAMGSCVLGLVLMAVCKGVQVYAAAQIFYWLGNRGMSYTISVFIADTSSLKNRGFMFAYVNSSFIITTWISGPFADRFKHNFQWGFGAFSIIMTVTSTPLFLLFLWNYRKAVKAGAIVPRKMIEFDAIGLLLSMSGLVLFILPFSLYSIQPGGWRSPLIITFFICGGLLLIAFVLYEKNFAQKTFIPYFLLKDRTILGSNILAATLFVSFFLWNAYFSSFLQVVSNLSLVQSTYVTNIYSVGSCLFSLVVGVAIHMTGKFKWIALYFGVPFTMLGVGLMILFRQPNQHVGWVIMCQVFIAFAGGACVITEQVAAMAAIQHQHIAVILALEGMFTSVAGGIGNSVATAIWTSVFPSRLALYLPEESKPDAALIYGDLTKQTSYPKGSAERIAIERAYGDAQKYMCTASLAVLVIGLAAVFAWRDIKVGTTRQVRGRVV